MDRLAQEDELVLNDSSEELSFITRLMGKNIVSAIGAFVIVFNMLFYAVYFLLAVLSLQFVVYRIITVICAAWWLRDLPRQDLSIIDILKSAGNEDKTEIEVERGINYWLRNAVFFSHALLTIYLIIFMR